MKMRNNDNEFNNIYEKIENTCSKLNIAISEIRKRKISVKVDNRPNTSSVIESKKEEIKFFSYYFVLDSLVHSLEDRFNQETKNLIVSKIMKLKNYEETDIEIVSEYFNLNQESLKAEIRLLYQKAVEEKIFKFGVNIRIWLQWFSKNRHNESVYKYFFKLIKNFSVIPVTSCTCERCFLKL